MASHERDHDGWNPPEPDRHVVRDPYFVHTASVTPTLRLDAVEPQLPHVLATVRELLAGATATHDPSAGYADKIRGTYRGAPVVVMLGCRGRPNTATGRAVRMCIEAPVSTRGSVATVENGTATDSRFALPHGHYLAAAPRELFARVFERDQLARLGAIIAARSTPAARFEFDIDRDRVSLDVRAPSDHASVVYLLDAVVDVATRLGAALPTFLASVNTSSLDHQPEVVALRQGVARGRMWVLLAVAVLVVIAIGFGIVASASKH
jgi:hypothetical protein